MFGPQAVRPHRVQYYQMILISQIVTELQQEQEAHYRHAISGIEILTTVLNAVAIICSSGGIALIVTGIGFPRGNGPLGLSC